MLDVGVLVETLETATFWSDVDRVYAAVRDALTGALGDKALVLCHISHVYETGCSLYFTVAVPEAEDPLAQWQVGQGRRQRRDDRAPAPRSPTTTPSAPTTSRGWPARSATVGVAMLRAVKAELDPTGVLNPGVLIP